MHDPRAPRSVTTRALIARALMACAGTLSLLSASLGAAQDCFDPEAELDPNGYVADLFRFEGETVTHPFALYREPCDGALYLVALPEGERLVRVNPSWQANHIISARWLEDEGSERIEIVANFSTGIGPEGARSFPARFVVSQTAGGTYLSAYDETPVTPWAALPSSELLEQPQKQPLDLLKTWLTAAQDGEEGPQAITIHLGNNSTSNRALAEIAPTLPRRADQSQVEMLIEISGLADDSVSAQRFYAIANRGKGEWRLEQVWRQLRCARSANPDAWQAAACP